MLEHSDLTRKVRMNDWVELEQKLAWKWEDDRK